MKIKKFKFFALFIMLMFLASSFAATNTSTVSDSSTNTNVDSTLRPSPEPGTPLVFNSSTRPSNGPYQPNKVIFASNDMMTYNKNMANSLVYCLDPYTPKPSTYAPPRFASVAPGILPGFSYVTNGSLFNSNLTGVNWDKVSYILENFGDVVGVPEFDPLGPSLSASQVEVAAVQAAIWYYTTQPLGEFSLGKNKWQYLTNPHDGLVYQTKRVYNPETGVWDPIFILNESVVNRAWEIIKDTDSANPLSVYRITLETEEKSSTWTRVTALVTSKNDTPIADQIVTFNVIKDGVSTIMKGLTDSLGQVLLDVYKQPGEVIGVNATVESKYHTLFVSPEGWQQMGSVKTNVTNISTFLVVPASNETVNDTPVNNNTGNDGPVNGTVPINGGNIPVNSNAIVKAVSMQNTGVPVLLIAFIILLAGIGLYRKN